MREYQWPNLPSMFFIEAQKSPKKPFLWRKSEGTYSSIDWHQTEKIICSIAAGLLSQKVKHGDRIALISENRPEWLIADFAIMSIGAITVPAYITNTIEDFMHIFQDSGCVGVIVSSKILASRVIPALQKTTGIKFVISIEELEQSSANQFSIFQWNEILSSHKQTDIEKIKEIAWSINNDMTACIIYTSGTGGAPKGVMLSHRNLFHNIEGAQHVLLELGLEENVFLSFLPLSHSYEHMAGQFVPISIGAEIFYAEGIETLSTNMLEARPTIMTAVPRLYETMYQRITMNIKKNGGVKEKLFTKSIELGKKRYQGQDKLNFLEVIQDSFLDQIVRKKVQSRFGGRLKALVSGGAPLNPEIGMFFTSLGLRILQGYGQTETAPLISANLPSNPKMHTVGPPVKGTEVKIAEDGEILVRGELIMQGYWQNKKATREVIKNGWIHTGDIGIIDEENHLQITDRKRDIIVNSGGDNISPQRVEGILCLEEEIAQAVVFGDKRPHLIALIVAEEIWMKSSKNQPNEAMRSIIDRANKKLSNIEKIRRFILTKTPFSTENGQLTPTMKVRRHIIYEIYHDKLETLYS